MRGWREAIPWGLAVALGLAITWVDSRPGWDDTGLSAAAIFLATACLSLAWPSRAWAWPLAVGGWIPLWALLMTHNPGAALALIIAAIGAGAGYLARKWVDAVRRPPTTTP